MENILIQYLFILVVSMIPFLEVFITVPTGIIVFGLPPVFVVIMSVIGNVISVFLFIFFGSQIYKLFYVFPYRQEKKHKKPKGMGGRMKRTFNRCGINGVSFLSSLLFSSQIGSSAMMSLGGRKNQVFLWTNLGVITLAIVMAILSIVAEEFVSLLVDI